VTTFTYAGDSTTAQGSSWLGQITAADLTNVGGVAVSGATSAAILAQVAPVTADVLVVMLGVNDVRLGKTRAEVKSNIADIVDIVGATRVLLCAIAPSDETDYGTSHLDRRTLGFALNRDLSQFAADNGWMFADPWSSIRLLSNGYASGATSDGVHPTPAASMTNTGPRMTVYIRQAHKGASA
jgi:lysophospholipase L1-like esterase